MALPYAATTQPPAYWLWRPSSAPLALAHIGWAAYVAGARVLPYRRFLAAAEHVGASRSTTMLNTTAPVPAGNVTQVTLMTRCRRCPSPAAP